MEDSRKRVISLKQAANSATYQERRAKLTQIFRYVQSFNHLQNPVQQEIQEQPWVLWLRHLPNHPGVRLRTITTLEHANTTSKEHPPTEDDFILKVSRPKTTEAPEPPKEIAPWLQNGWQDIDGTAKLDQTRIYAFNDDPKRLQLFEHWVQQRNSWIETERPVRNALRLYDRLNELRARLERESERLELMLGDGPSLCSSQCT